MAVKTGTVTFFWGDGEYAFRLALGELQELERKTGAGPLELYQRIANGTWKVGDLREIIRNGLIGGGMKADAAGILIKRYVDEFPLLHNVEPASAIMLSALFGPPEDKPKKAMAEGSQVTGASPSADFTKTAPQSDSAPAMSTT